METAVEMTTTPLISKEMTTFRPSDGKLTAVVEDRPLTTAGGIELTRPIDEDTETAWVVWVGGGLWLESGDQLPMPCKAGDLIVIARHAGIDHQVGPDHTLRILGHSDVLCVIEGA